MPLLSITSTNEIESPDKEQFFRELAELYADVMDSGTSFVAIKFRVIPRTDVWLGRAGGTRSDIVILDADIRAGRPPAQRREFAVEFMDKVRDEWGVPRSNLKVVFTEHEGSQMMGYDRIGSDWTSDE